MIDITELAQLRDELLSPAIGSSAHLRKIALSLVDELEKAQQQNKSDFEIKARLCKESNSLHDRLREAEKRIAELEREQEQLRPVGVMSEQAFHRLENRECRFIALWPRPGIFLPRKRPEDGVIVYARTAAAAGIKVEAE